MKKQLLVLLAFIVLALTSNAQVTLQTFQIGQNYLQNSSTLKIPNIAVATPFKFIIVTTRGISSSGGYVSGNCKVSLYYTENQSADSNIPDDPSSVLMKTVNITSSNYNQSQAILADIDASLPPNKQNGKLVLRFEFTDNQNINRVSYSTTRYSIYVVPPQVVVTITNNIISLYNNGVNYPSTIGSKPIISPNETYSESYEIKNANGVFETALANGYIISGDEVNGGFITGIMAVTNGGTYRRVINTRSGARSYSNEIVVPPSPTATPNTYTVTKTEVFDNNGLLIGNKIKIILDHPDSNIRFRALIFGAEDPQNTPINSNYEFFIPYIDTIVAAGLTSNAGNNLNITPTWK
ncbi:hypothetical protein [Pedobacter psychrodurus]|uniref:hypothetical protein n=1 Tax=Pedobacter psychrodurus TaxID=2530456 RepID=UPI0029312117|nr:hypothetical protein [Pedobacter psychrodurus]